jgi:hypothetical protein
VAALLSAFSVMYVAVFPELFKLLRLGVFDEVTEHLPTSKNTRTNTVSLRQLFVING